MPIERVQKVVYTGPTDDLDWIRHKLNQILRCYIQIVISEYRASRRGDTDDPVLYLQFIEYFA